MWRSREAIILYIVLVAVAAHIAVYAPQLPDRVPSHFGASGRADSWSSAAAFVTTYAVSTAVLALVFVGGAVLMLKSSPRWMSLPRKDYWFAPEREATTRRFLARSLLWFGAVTIAFMAVLMHLSMLAALDRTDTLGPAVWWLLGGFVLYSLVWSIRLTVRFGRVPRAADERRSP